MPSNSLTLVGNLTQDPELKFVGDKGTALATFSVAVTRKGYNGKEDKTSKGTRVVVTGDLEQRSWQTEDGQKRSAVEVRVEAIGPDLRFASASVTKVFKDPAKTEEDAW